MDVDPDPALLPNELVAFVRSARAWQRLCDEWDRMYPTNPVSGNDDETE